MATGRAALLAAALVGAALQGACRDEPSGEAASGEPGPAAAADRGRVATTALYDLRSDPEVNLHHFLYAWARQERPLEGWNLVEVPEREALDELPPPERAAWQEAVAFYRREIAPRDLLFGAGMEELRDAVAGLAERALLDEAERVAEVLARARPIYRGRWWPQHDAANRRWIEALAPALARHEPEMARRVAAAYGGTWPAAPIRVDVTPYAHYLGAYTSGKPHVTISSTDPGYAMPRALEMIFHETSHADSLTRPLLTLHARHFGVVDRRPPRWFWHLTIFYTAGEVTRLVLAEAGQPGYTHLGRDELYAGSPERLAQVEALDRHWRPFLDGQATRDEAMTRLVAELAADRAG